MCQLKCQLQFMSYYAIHIVSSTTGDAALIECPVEERGVQQPAPRNCDAAVVSVRTIWNRIGGPF